jgi:hypothetical protein
VVLVLMLILMLIVLVIDIMMVVMICLEIDSIMTFMAGGGGDGQFGGVVMIGGPRVTVIIVMIMM